MNDPWEVLRLAGQGEEGGLRDFWLWREGGVMQVRVLDWLRVPGELADVSVVARGVACGFVTESGGEGSAWGEWDVWLAGAEVDVDVVESLEEPFVDGNIEFLGAAAGVAVYGDVIDTDFDVALRDDATEPEDGVVGGVEQELHLVTARGLGEWGESRDQSHQGTGAGASRVAPGGQVRSGRRWQPRVGGELRGS